MPKAMKIKTKESKPWPMAVELMVLSQRKRPDVSVFSQASQAELENSPTK